MAVMREQVMQEAMDMSGVQAPLAMRMMENIPGIATSVGFSTARGTNTLMRGGFMDYKYAKGSRMASKFRLMDEAGVLSERSAANFIGGGRIAGGRGILGRRAARLSTESTKVGRISKLVGAESVEKAGWLRGARVNNITMRPRALGRFHSLSVFKESGTYTPFGAAHIMGNSKFGRKIAANAGVDPAAGGSAFGPGLLSFITAGRKTDLLERSGSRRAAKKLATVDRNIGSLAKMNNPGIVEELKMGRFLKKDTAERIMQSGALKDTGMSIGNAAGRYSLMGGSYADRSMLGLTGNALKVEGKTIVGASESTMGVRGNLMASSVSGEATRYMAGYFRGAQGFATRSGLEGKALTGAQKAVAHMTEALGEKQIAGKVGMEAAQHVLENGVFKELGGKGVMEALGSKAGMKVLGARAGAMAIPGLNVIATASLVYDLGKMAGEVVKSGINLAKDAGKSLQGDINKPLFGMGYKDTEAAATSRSRGVMAIQNSRLNARSMLGSEGAMMAAHYG